MAIDVREHYNTWITEQVVPLFEKAGIKVTPGARNLLAHALQSQVEEGLVANDRVLFDSSTRFRRFAVQMHAKKFGVGELNFNRAMHLILALTCA